MTDDTRPEQPSRRTLAQEVASLGDTPPTRDAPAHHWARRTWVFAAVPTAAVILALAVGAVIITLSSIVITGALDVTLWIEGYAALLEGGLGMGSGDPLNAITRTVTNSAPLLLAGLSVALGFKAGLFNIGATGQFVIGGLAAAVAGAAVAGWSPYLAIPVAVVAGAAASAFYGFIPGFLKATTGAHEVVTTIMLNYIALFTGTALVIGVFRAPGYTFDRTADVGAAVLPVVFGRDLHLGVLIAYAFVPIFWWFVWKTTVGFDPHRRRQPQCRPLRRHEPAAAHHDDHVAMRAPGGARRRRHLPGRDRLLPGDLRHPDRLRCHRRSPAGSQPSDRRHAGRPALRVHARRRAPDADPGRHPHRDHRRADRGHPLLPGRRHHRALGVPDAR